MAGRFLCCLLLIVITKPADASTCRKPSAKDQHWQESVDTLIEKSQNSIRPNVTGGPTAVEISIHFVRLDELKTIDESYTSDIFLRLKWNDTRYCHNETESIVMEGDSSKKFWYPDIFFVNALKTTEHSSRYIRISPNGEMLRSVRVTVVARCEQDLTYFPVDVQNCEMIIESYSYSTKQLTVKWSKVKPISFETKKMAQFEITKVGQSAKVNSYSTGLFSQLSVQIKLERRVGYYIIQIFVPCFIVVGLSWLTFWMCPENIGDRSALGISSVLTIVLLMTSINSDLPKVSYAKAIDYYLMGCFLYVFLVVIETIIAYHLHKRFHKEKTAKQTTGRRRWWRKGIKVKFDSAKALELNGMNAGNENGDMNQNRTNRLKKRKRQKHWQNIDSYCRVFFPLFFVLLNIAYWVWCISLRNKGVK